VSETPRANGLKHDLIAEMQATHDPAHVCRYAMREAVDVCGKLERENNELRAIFPKILQALESGFCADDCSVEFLRHIPSEVASVTSRLRRENNELKKKLKELEEKTLNRLIGYNQ
jgi:hypothetical protein